MNNIVKNFNTMLNAEGINKDIFAAAIKAEANYLAEAGEITEAEKQGIIHLADELA